MKVSITGENPVTPDQFKEAMEIFNNRYKDLGVCVHSAICYVKFANQKSEVLDVVDADGDSMEIYIHFDPNLPYIDEDIFKEKDGRTIKKFKAQTKRNSYKRAFEPVRDYNRF